MSTNEQAASGSSDAPARVRKYGSRTDALDTIADVDLTGRTILITGTTSGIGVETARALALKGAHVVMANRNPVRAEALKKQILDEKPDAEVDLITCELSSLQSVQAAANEFKGKKWPLHALVLNAAVEMSPSTKTTVDGLETTLAVNQIAHQYLVRQLLPLLRQSKGRVVVVTSSSHQHTGLKPDMTVEEKIAKLCSDEYSGIFGYRRTNRSINADDFDWLTAVFVDRLWYSYIICWFIHIRTEMPEGARRFLEELAVKTRKNFCEEDVQGLLEYHHDQLGRLLDRGPSLEEEYKQLRLDMINGAQDRPLQTYKRGCVWLKDILLFIEKLKHIRAETWTLWETYDLLIEANWASTNDYHRFVRKQRRDERPISRTTTSAVCTSEINHWEYRADEFHGLLTHFGEEGVQSQAPETTILQAIEQINGRLCKIEEQLEHRRVQDDNIHEAVRHWEAATNELKESVKRSLEAAANEFREEVRRASRSLSHSSSAESRKRPRRESHDHEDELTRLRRKLNELSNCSERYLGNAEQVVLVHGAVVRCVFCGEKGLHHPDNCPYVRTLETRRSLLTRQGICLRCLGFCNASCQTECSYCRSTRHNTAVCLLPEERQKISAKIAELSSSEAEYRDERDERRREPGKTGTRESHM